LIYNLITNHSKGDILKQQWIQESTPSIWAQKVA